MARKLNRRIAMMMGLLVLLVAGCDWAENATVDVAISEDGEAFGLGREGVTRVGVEQPVAGVGIQLEVELRDGTMIRIERDSIVESTDNFETSEVAWQIEPDANWWSHEFGPFRPELFDVIELPDGTAATAAGEIGLLQRQPDGVWTPTVAELRTLPLMWLLLGLAGVSAMALSLMMAFGPLTHGRSFAWGATMMLLPFTAFSLLALHGNTLVGILALFFVPLAVQAFGTTIGAVLRSEGTPRYVTTFATVGSAVVGLQTVIYCALYLLWSRDMFGYTSAVWGAAITPVVLISGGALFLGHRVGRTSLPPAPDVQTMGWLKSSFLGVVAPMCVSFVLIFFVGLPLLSNPLIFALAALWVVGFAGLGAYTTWRSAYVSVDDADETEPLTAAVEA